jgi:hypothetical protein
LLCGKAQGARRIPFDDQVVHKVFVGCAADEITTAAYTQALIHGLFEAVMGLLTSPFS